MRIQAEHVEIGSYKSDIRLGIEGINFYKMYMENDTEEIKKFLNEIPLEELEEYILKRKSEEK